MEITYTPPADNSLIPPGEYTFEILKVTASREVERDVSKLKLMGFTSEQIQDANAEIALIKLTLTLNLTSAEGEPFDGKDNFKLQPNMMWKLKQLRAACGYNDTEGQAVRVRLEDFQEKTGKVRISSKKSKKGTDFNEFTYLKPTESEGDPF